MSKTKISQYDADPANNTDIDGINLAEGMAPGLVNNAIREMMAQLKDFQQGSVGDNLTVGGNLSVTGDLDVTGNLAVTGTASLGSNTIDALPSGTKMLFQQSAAPTGWTKDTTNNDKALRVVSGTAGTGGSVAFTTAFASQNVGDTTLTESQIPSHTHTFSGSGNTGEAGGHNHSVNDPGHTHVLTGSQSGLGSTHNKLDATNSGTTSASSTTSSTTGISINAVGNHVHTVSVSGTTSTTGGGTAHTHSLDLAVSYVDVIVATKD